MLIIIGYNALLYAKQGLKLTFLATSHCCFLPAKFYFVPKARVDSTENTLYGLEFVQMTRRSEASGASGGKGSCSGSVCAVALAVMSRLITANVSQIQTRLTVAVHVYIQLSLNLIRDRVSRRLPS